MPRPKGSKNKKTLAKNADIDAQISEKNGALAALEEEYTTVSQIIAENSAKLKALKKDMRVLSRQIASLEAKKAESAAAALAAEKKQEVQAKIDALVADGKSLDDILNMLK